MGVAVATALPKVVEKLTFLGVNPNAEAVLLSICEARNGKSYVISGHSSYNANGANRTVVLG